MIDPSKFDFIPIQNTPISLEKPTCRAHMITINNLRHYLVTTKILQSIRPCRCKEMCAYKKLHNTYLKMVDYNRFLFNEF